MQGPWPASASSRWASCSPGPSAVSCWPDLGADVIKFEDPGRAPAARFGLARAAAAAPAMFGSLLLVLVAAGGLGARAPLVAVTWASYGAVALTRGGERAVVRVALGFRRPHPQQAAVLQPLWSTALGLAGTSANDVELYVQQGRQLNAYATGGRSVAATSRVLHDHRAGRLSGEQVVAALVHELGHHATGATRPMLITMWLAAPRRGALRGGRWPASRAVCRAVNPVESLRRWASAVSASPWCFRAAGALARRRGSGRSRRALRGDLPVGRRVGLLACRVRC